MVAHGRVVIGTGTASLVSSNPIPVLLTYYLGPHNLFCDVCGGAQELFGCQTCGASYHASCMSPSLEDDQVPTFWFCPHCVNNNFHIPVDGMVDSTPTTRTAEDPPLQSTSTSGGPTTAIPGADQYPTPQTPGSQLLPIPVANQLNGDNVTDINVQSGNDIARQHETPGQREKPITMPEAVQPTKRSRPKRGQSPPKKKSKYSVFSAEVDKALAVIHSELELAAEGSRSEHHLNRKVESLEQQLRLQSGQMALLRQELDMTKRDLEIERFRVGRLEAICKRPSQEVTRLTDLLTQKDEELNDWKDKLKRLVDS